MNAPFDFAWMTTKVTGAVSGPPERTHSNGTRFAHE
jgi:hypothetical protein